MRTNEYVETHCLEKRKSKNISDKLNCKLSVVLIIPPELRKVKGISFYKLSFDEDTTTEYIESTVKKLINSTRFYLVDHMNNLLKQEQKLKKCCTEEDGNIYLYVCSI